MGVIKRGILGGFSGRVANVVGASWKGIAYMRAIPLSVSNPRTVAQTANRTAFGTAGEMAKQLVNTLMPLNWNGLAQRMSGYNLWIKENVKFITDWDTADWSDIEMVKGTIPAPTIDVVEASEGAGTLVVEWDTTTLDGLFANPPKSFASQIKKKLKSCSVEQPVGSVYGDGSFTLDLDENYGAGDEIELYLMFYDDVNDVWSKSAHATVTVGA